MSEEPEIEVEIEQDAPVVEAKKDGSEDAIALAIREQAKEYEVKLVAEREEKEAARRRADTAEREARVATARVADSDLDSVTNAISMVEMQREKVKRQLKDAMEAGDFDGTVKAQEDLSEAITKLNALKEGKNYIEQRKSEPVNVDPQEAYIGKFTQRSQEYLRQHRELVTNENKNKRMISAHYEAEAEGHKPDSEAYFQFLDNKLGYADAPKRLRRACQPVLQYRGAMATFNRAVTATSSSFRRARLAQQPMDQSSGTLARTKASQSA